MNLHTFGNRLPIYIIFSLITLFFLGCTPTVREPKANHNDNLLISYPLESVEIYLNNNTDFYFERVIISSDEDVQVDAGPIEPRTTIGPFSVPYVYQLFSGSITMNGIVTEVEVFDHPELTGEPPITTGSYTYDLEDFGEGLGGFIRPNVDISQARLAPFIELLEKEGGEFRYQSSIQRGNVFNLGVGDQIQAAESTPDTHLTIFMPMLRQGLEVNRPIDSGKSATELFYLRKNTQLWVYIFADQVAAENAYKRINVGTATVRVTHEDGSTSNQPDYYWDGDQPVWWLLGNLILLTDGRDNLIYEQINNVVGSYPIGGPKPEFVPTPTPMTPVIESNIYMARRNFDSDICNDAGLTGTLILEDNLLYLGSVFIVWPRLYSIREFNGVPAVIDSNGKIVARVGDEVLFGGSDIPEGSTFWRENLVSPLPDRFKDDTPVWNMCSYVK